MGVWRKGWEEGLVKTCATLVFCFVFFWLCCTSCVVLVPRPEIEGIKLVPPPTSVQRKRWVLTSGPPGRSLYLFYIVVTKINYTVLEEIVNLSFV